MSTPDSFSELTGFDGLYGLEILDLAPELAHARLAVRDDHKQPWGIVHGGVYAAMAESITSWATAAVVVPEGKIASGMSNQTSFLRPVSAGTITATAVRKHAGRTTWVWEVELVDEQGRLCALSRMTIAIRDVP